MVRTAGEWRVGDRCLVEVYMQQHREQLHPIAETSTTLTDNCDLMIAVGIIHHQRRRRRQQQKQQQRERQQQQQQQDARWRNLNCCDKK